MRQLTDSCSLWQLHWQASCKTYVLVRLRRKHASKKCVHVGLSSLTFYGFDVVRSQKIMVGIFM